MTNDMNKVESNLYKSLGNGKGAAMYLSVLVADAASSGDATFVCRAIVRAQQKGDEQAANLFKRVLAAVYPQGKLNTKEGNVTFARNKTDADMSVVNALAVAADKDLSIRGAAFKAAVFGKPAPKTAEEKFAAAVRSALAAGMSIDAMSNIIADSAAVADAA